MQRLMIAVLALALGAPLAYADKPDKNKDKGKKEKGHKPDHPSQEAGNRDHHGRPEVFEPRHREATRTWWTETYGRGCPPGLAKKNNGCLPPGQAKKRYVVGRRLTSSVRVEPLPPVLYRHLGDAPHGYEYVIVDGDVLKLVVGTRLVIDAIDGLR